VFIIESLTLDDEREGRLEGGVLSEMLRLSGKESQYFYIRTKHELEAVMDEFDASQMRYLHLSCHGNAGSLFTTLDEVPFSELGRAVRPYLAGRRLFVSACEAVNGNLATAVMRRNGCYSIVGPAKNVGFDEAAVMWAAFYHLMFKNNATAMKGADIRSTLTRLIGTFDVPLSYIRRTGTAPYWKEAKLIGATKLG
jgi:hypothetical protein